MYELTFVDEERTSALLLSCINMGDGALVEELANGQKTRLVNVVRGDKITGMTKCWID